MFMLVNLIFLLLEQLLIIVLKASKLRQMTWEPWIISSHTAPQKIAKEISFHMITNAMMVAEQV